MKNENENRTQKNKSSYSIGAVIRWVLSIIGTLFIGLVLGLVLEFGGIYLEYWDIEHAQETTATELNWSNKKVSELFSQEPIVHKINDIGLEISSLASPEIGGYMYAANSTIQTYLLRIITIISMWPLLGIMVLSSGIDGAVERALRRYGAGRESSGKFNASKWSVGFFYLAPSMIYLSWPTAANPLHFLFLPTLMVSISVRFVISKYMKH